MHTLETVDMSTSILNIEVDSDAASIYSTASDEDKSKLSTLWSVLLREYRANAIPLVRLMDQIGANAGRRGLTPRKLESILRAEA